MDHDLSTSQSMKSTGVKIRGTYFKFINCDVHPCYMSAVTLKKMYESVDMPGGLYGCEPWNQFDEIAESSQY